MSNTINQQDLIAQEANQRFLSLYCSKPKASSKQWMEYFTSPAFLELARSTAFIDLLVEEVKEHQASFPLSNELCTCLSIVYSVDPCDTFDAAKIIAESLASQKELRAMDRILAYSFTEYWKLVSYAEHGIWKDRQLLQYMKIVEFHKSSHIEESYRTFQTQDCQRHPLGVKLLTHFFEQYPLPDKLYRIAWQSLDLRSAKYGRSKVLYGQLRKIIIDKLPGIEQEPEEKLGEIHHTFIQCCARCNQRDGSDPEKDLQEIDEFWNQPGVSRALTSFHFVFENLICGIWIGDSTPIPLLNKIRTFYQDFPDAPFSKDIIHRIDTVLCELEPNDTPDDCDEEDEIPDSVPPLSHRAFFRYWLYVCNNIIFSSALSAGLMQTHPRSYVWTKSFLKLDEGKHTPSYQSVTYSLSDKEECAQLEIRFYLNHMEAWVNGQYVFRPVFDWDWLVSLNDNNLFLHLLPFTVTFCDRCHTVQQEILHRLFCTIPFLTDGELHMLSLELAEHVCRIPAQALLTQALDDPSKPFIVRTARELLSLLPCHVLMEGTETLYECSWLSGENKLTIFKKNGSQFYMEAVQQHTCTHDEEILSLALETLSEITSPSDYSVSKITVLPVAVYAVPNQTEEETQPASPELNIPRELTKDQITREALVRLISLFEAGKLNRLEIAWEMGTLPSTQQDYPVRRSLVFLKEGDKMACLCFEDATGEIYGLLCGSSPYQIGDDFVSFGLDQLFPKHVHKDFESIRTQLKKAFQCMNDPNGLSQWSQAVIVYHGRNKYNVDKRMLGGFPVEWAHNSLTEKFYMEDYPCMIQSMNFQGRHEAISISSSNRFKVQSTLQQFMKNQLSQLCLSWSYGVHIALLAQDGRYLLVFLRDETQAALFFAADAAEFKKSAQSHCDQQELHGISVPPYLIYHDLVHLRADLELLLAKVLTFNLVAEKMPPHLNTTKGNPDAYLKIRAALLGGSSAQL